MFRMLLEVVMVFGLIGGLFLVNKTLARESKANRAAVRARLAEMEDD